MEDRDQVIALWVWFAILFGFLAYAVAVLVARLNLRTAPTQSVTFQQGPDLPELQTFPNVVRQ